MLVMQTSTQSLLVERRGLFSECFLLFSHILRAGLPLLTGYIPSRFSMANFPHRSAGTGPTAGGKKNEAARFLDQSEPFYIRTLGGLLLIR